MLENNCSDMCVSHFDNCKLLGLTEIKATLDFVAYLVRVKKEK